MAVYMIGYDKAGPDYDYQPLTNAIENFGDFIHPLESTWLITSDLKAGEILDILKPHLHKDDKLLITRVDNAAGTGLGSKNNSWFLRQLR